mgnify:CR=1 FL=1
MSDNWVVQNLENALETWNEKLSEIWTLITTTPQNFKGGNIWKVIVDINGAVQAIGLALLVLFFVIGMVKTCGSFTDVKKPEHALKLFVRFCLGERCYHIRNGAYACIIQYCARYDFNHYECCRIWNSGTNDLARRDGNDHRGLRIFREYSIVGGNAYRRIIYHSAFVHSDNDGVRKIFQVVYVHSTCTDTAFHICRRTDTECRQEFYTRAIVTVLLEGAVIVLACIIFSVFASSPPVVNPDAAAVTQVWAYIGELVFNMLVLVGAVKMSDRIIREMMGL